MTWLIISSWPAASNSHHIEQVSSAYNRETKLQSTGIGNTAQQLVMLQFMAKSLTFVSHDISRLWIVVPLLARQNIKDRIKKNDFWLTTRWDDFLTSSRFLIRLARFPKMQARSVSLRLDRSFPMYKKKGGHICGYHLQQVITLFYLSALSEAGANALLWCNPTR